jgi:hypothetical protein
VDFCLREEGLRDTHNPSQKIVRLRTELMLEVMWAKQ